MFNFVKIPFGMSKRIITYIVLLISAIAFSQTDKQKQLEAQKAQIQKQIANYKEMLQSEQSKEKSVLEKIEEQRTKIRLTEALIKTTQEQEKLLEKDILANEKEISILNAELESLKADYAQMIIKSYESRSQQSKLMFLLSSDNFLQAYKRIQYMKQYAEFRKEQGKEVQQKSEVLAEKNKALQKQKAEKEKLVKQTQAELDTLEKEKKALDALMVIIERNKKKYTQDIKKKQQEVSNINKQIEKLKREAIAEANRKKAEAEAKATGKKVDEKSISSTKYDLTPEGKIIADNFKANKGKLPWPVERGVITSHYGIQPHPVVKNIPINNQGVDFKTVEGAEVRAVFEGEVSRIMVVTPVNMAVWVRHGDYVTIYGNLDKVYVKKGDKVGFKQKLGRVHTYPNGVTTTKFMVFQNITTLNPEHWLAPN